MKNMEFKKIYSARLRTLLQTVFKPENSIAVLDSLYEILKPEMAGEFNRWAPANKNWEQNVQAIRDFLMNRPVILGIQMYQYLPFVTETREVSTETTVSAYPNPFDNRVTIHLRSTEKGPLDITVLGEDGRRIITLFSGYSNGDKEEITWEGDDANGKKAPPGLYILHISNSSQSQYLKIIRK
jgi:hypothetical protein